MDRALKAGVSENWRHRQHASVEALHVAGAAAVKTAGVLAQSEWRARPRLGDHRHDIGMARQNHAAVPARPDRGEDCRLAAGRVRGAARFKSMLAQVAFNK